MNLRQSLTYLLRSHGQPAVTETLKEVLAQQFRDEQKRKDERNDLLIRLREEGHTFKSLGERFHISTERCQQIYRKHLRMEDWLKREALRLEEQKQKDEEFQRLLPADLNPLLLEKVSDLDLCVRAEICLRNARIDTLGQLVQMTEAGLLKTKNFGRKSLKEIKEVLAAKGLRLEMPLTKSQIAAFEATQKRCTICGEVRNHPKHGT